MKPISPTFHGVLDYLTCIFFAIAPTLFNLHDFYSTVCYLLAGGYFIITLFTNMPLGAVKSIPFWLHGKLELVSGPVFILSPWLFGYAGENPTARNLFVASGVVFLFVYFLTQWHPQEQRTPTANGGVSPSLP